MRKMDAEQTPGRGRPTVGPKVETRLSPEAIAAVDERAQKAGISRAELLRSLITEGLDDGPQSASDLHKDDRIDTIAWRYDRDEMNGATVDSDGTTYWVTCFETGEMWGSTTSSTAAALLTASLLLDYERIKRWELVPDSNDDSPAYPELVAAGREIAASSDDFASDLAAAAQRIAARNA